MAQICALIPLLFTLTSFAQSTVTLDWQHDDVANVSFNVWHYSAVGQPGTVLTNVVGTNGVRLAIQPGMHLFTVTASNFWGESPHSNTVGTPAKANGPTHLRINR